MMKLAAKLLSAGLVLVGLANGLASTDTITWGGDNSRAGYQSNHNMDPSVVASSQFAQIFKTPLPGNYIGAKEQTFSQPLVYTPSSGDGTQYVYFSTTQNNVYKLNAKTGEIVASRNLHIPFLTADLDGCVDINPTVGIIGTGVIDPGTDTLYLAAKTYADQNGGTGPQGKPNGRYFIHALDVNDLSERPNYPIDLEGTVARNNPLRSFNGGIHLQRPGLLHSGQYIYAGFGSHCVQYNFTGWIMGWDKTTGELVERFATQGDGVPNDVKGAGIWMSGGGLASDNAGSMFYATGNGYASQLSTIPVNGHSPPTALEEAAVHMTMNEDGSLTVVDFFMPWDKQALDGADKDLGTSPLEILPGEFACGDVKRIGVVTGKSGKTYWINLDNMGGYRNGPGGLDAVIQTYQNENSVYAGAGVYPLEGGYVYINVIQYPSHVFKFSCNNGVPSFTKVADSPTSNAYILGVSHGTTTSLDGQPGTGLLWVTDVQNVNVRIYDAVPQDGELNLVKSFTVPGITKFTRPVFGDGIMYLATGQGFAYGFGSPVTPPVECAVESFGVGNLGDESEPQTVTCTAAIGISVASIELDEATDFALSELPTLPLTVATGNTFTFNATFQPTDVGLISDAVVITTANTVEGFSTETRVRLTGTGSSSGPLLDISPTTLSFDGVVTGENPEGVDGTALLVNEGNSILTISEVLFSESSADGPFTPWDDSTSTLQVGQFSMSSIPSTIEATSEVALSVNFNSTSSGTFVAFVKFVSDGGEKVLSIAAISGPAAMALLEFQTTDGTGWVTYEEGTPFDFGNVTQNTQRPLKMHLTNAAPAGGVKLSITVSKPPFGVSGYIGAVNQVDLAEGVTLEPGESETATLYCSVPKRPWNTDPVDATAVWTMNLNDLDFGKQTIEFACKGVAEQALPLLEDGQGQYRYIGCFKENNPGRQLADQLYGSDENTNAICIAACADANLPYCGTQYHRECWAGPQMPSLQVDDANCNFDCSGDLFQYCGGNGVGANEGGSFISLYGDLEWEGPTGPVVNPGVSGYVSIGCYTEATSGRALPNGKSVETRTVANCVNACAADNYIYAGVEYGGECWCGNSFRAGAVPAPDADCSMTCNGNATEYCGGPSRLNVYQLEDAPLPSSSSTSSTSSTSSNTGTASSTSVSSTSTSPTPTGPAIKETVGEWEFQGCYTEATGHRALSDDFLADDAMTLEMCAAFCDGHTYFGAEYGRECWCGNALYEGSVPATNQADCSFPCAGDPSEFCGAGQRLELYMIPGAASSATSASSSSVPSSSTSLSVATSSSSATSSSATTSTSATSSSVDSSSTSTSSASSSSTTSSSSSSVPTTTATTSSTSSSSTTTTSSSTTTTTTSTSTSPLPTPTISPGNQNFTYYGCIREPSSGRLLPSQALNDGANMTIALCLSRCWMHDYAGVEYGRECWCGSVLDWDGNNAATPAHNVSDAECSFKCPGNQSEYCGAGVRLSLYARLDLEEE